MTEEEEKVTNQEAEPIQEAEMIQEEEEEAEDEEAKRPEERKKRKKREDDRIKEGNEDEGEGEEEEEEKEHMVNLIVKGNSYESLCCFCCTPVSTSNFSGNSIILQKLSENKRDRTKN